DSREALLRGGKSGAAVVPGNGAASLLIQVLEQTAKIKMPPSGKLPEELIAAFRRWVDLGAPFGATLAAKPANWWSLRPLTRPPVPEVSSSDVHWVRTPVDRFIAAKLREKNLSPSSEAGRRTMLRRVSFDLTGLPPTPEEMSAFLSDPAADAYEKVVDRLLDSPRYGERWARHWMDVVHFAETDGYESDMIRENSWPYRDYLIRSFNADKPYPQFIQEQVAGDVLFPRNPDGVIATGLLAAGPFDSNTIPPFSPDRPDVLRAYALDRDDMIQTVMASFNSMTVHCARCHDHKFDPIPQKDYYRLQAVFAGIDRADRPYDEDAQVHARRQELLRTRQALERRDPEIVAALLEPNRQADAAAWASSARARLIDWTPLRPAAASSKNGVTLQTLDDGSLLASGPIPESDTVSITVKPGTRDVTAMRLEFPPHLSLPMGGPGRSSQASFLIGEITVTAMTGSDAVPVCLGKPLADYEYEGSPISAVADGKPGTSWRNYPRHGEYRQIVLPFSTKLRLSAGDTLFVEIQQGGVQMVGRVRVSVTGQPLPQSLELASPVVASAVAIPPADWSLEQKREIAAHAWRQSIEQQLAALPKPKWVYAAANDFAPKGWFSSVRFPRPIPVLERGEVEKPGELMGPGALSCVAELSARFHLANPNEEGQRRAALARWLSDPANPLTWRSIVNRVWHYHFGRGIAETLNDFGRMGSAPTHPELLDWLAVEFRESGGSLKRLHRILVTSAVYRQSSKPNADHQKLDADNRYLWRMNRGRLDAESVRDAVLAVSGRLSLAGVGPSVRQAVVGKGVASAPAPDYAVFDWDSAGAGRRSVYRYSFRTLSDPFMDALNCPNASQMTPARTQSVDPLQALVLLNNPFMTRHSEHLAARVQAMADTPEGRIAALYRLAFLREPIAGELAEARQYASQHGLANLCRVILNSNEFMFVN
ncbi:MAG: PSD1 and planctomycete cytochrome C domain-containing protein, partial [Bryobacteraceae bacterium]